MLKVIIWDIFAPDETQEYIGARWQIETDQVIMVSNYIYSSSTTAAVAVKQYIKRFFNRKYFKINYDDRTNIEFLT